MEAAPADIVFEPEIPRSQVPTAAVAQRDRPGGFQPRKLPPGLEPGLFESGAWAPTDFTFPYGTHVCEVEIDPETGVVAHRPLFRWSTTWAP